MRNIVDYTASGREGDNKYAMEQVWDINGIPVQIKVQYTTSGYGSSASAFTLRTPYGFNNPIMLNDLLNDWATTPGMDNPDAIRRAMSDGAADMAFRMDQVLSRKWKIK